MSNNGFITLHRSILEWEWWGDQNVTRLFIYLMLRANHKKGRLRGVDINRGQTAVCYKTISNETGLSYKQVRAAIDKLCLTGEVSKKRAPKGHTFGNGIFQIIQINNYDKYQDKGTTRADLGQTLGRPWAPNNKKNNENNENNKSKGVVKNYPEDFEQFWAMYPRQRRGEKRVAFQKWRAKLKDGYTAEQMLQGVRQYQNSREVAEGYAKNAASWLYNAKFMDNYQPPKAKQDDAWDEAFKKIESGDL